MREEDLKAVVFLLKEIKNNLLLEAGVERLLNAYGYSDLDTLHKEFKQVSNAVSETDCAMVRCGILKEIQFYTWDIEKDMTPKLIVASDYRRFEEYCFRNELDHFKTVYITSLDFLR